MATIPSSKLLEEGDPTLDPRAFRRCLSQFATGIAIITTKVGDEMAGVTVNSFSSVSLDPPLVLWSISRTSRSFGLFEACDRFVINILSSEQIELSRLFSSKEVDKFAAADWSPGQGGVPLLNGVVAQFECRREAVHEGGDHLILVGRVARFATRGGEPLLFVQGRYGIPQDHPDLVEASAPIVEPAHDTGRGRSLLPLIFQAQHYLSASFDEHRRAEGANLAVGRLLAAVYDNPGKPLDALVRTTYLGERDAEDATAELVKRSCLVRDSNGGLSLTPEGRRQREAIRKRWQEFQAAQVKDMADSDIKATQKVLTTLIEHNKPDAEVFSV